MGRFPKPAKKIGSMANTHIHGTKADTSTMGGTKAIHIKKTARWPTTHGFTFYSTEGRGSEGDGKVVQTRPLSRTTYIACPSNCFKT
jgi:hypothetical protein